MAVVKTFGDYFGRVEHRFRIKVNAEGEFSIALPKHSHAALGQEEVRAGDMTSLMVQFREVKEKYADMLVTERKVIRYVFRLQDVSRETKYDETKRKDISFGVGAGLQLGVANLVERTHIAADGSDPNIEYEWAWQNGDPVDSPYPSSFNYGDFDSMSSSRLSGARVVEWTQEREDWFMSLCLAMDQLILRLRTLDEAPELLLEAAETGVPLLKPHVGVHDVDEYYPEDNDDHGNPF